MTTKEPTILLVEDDPSMAALTQSYLADQPYTLITATNGAQALSFLSSGHWDAVLLDLGLPDMNGMEILNHIREAELPTAVIVVTGDCAMSTVVEVMQAGARDFLAKPFPRSRLLTTLSNCVEQSRLQAVVETYQQELDRNSFDGFIGSSLVMQSVYKIIESAASSRATVFITGESGTGKEVCAEAIHQCSERRDKPFIAINCGAIPKDLIESEIFGHIKGAFTGALKDRDGAARAADGGTLFLDEICEMDLSLQTKLLRFLQTGMLQRVGCDRPEPVDVRIVCATNKDPMAQVSAGEFREDLFYRLHVLPIQLPPLREREGDVLEIAQSLLKQYADEEDKAFSSFSPEVETTLTRYNWPGNVRQLQNVIRNMVVLHNGDTIESHMLPPPLDNYLHSPQPQSALASQHPVQQQETVAQQPVQQPDISTVTRELATQNDVTENSDRLALAIRPLAELEREAIEHAINLCDGSIPTAAHYLGISAATIYRKRNSWKAAAE